MASLKEIKSRIRSIKSTQKITSAMKLVAASKVRKIQDRVFNSRPYTKALEEIIEKTVQAIPNLDKNEIPLMQKREIKSFGLVVISSDRGLCGSYNTNILKKSIKRIMDLKAEGKEVKLFLIGNKAASLLRKTGCEILDTFTQLPAYITVEMANVIATSCENAFREGKVDTIEIIGTNFISMLKSDVYTKNFLPVIVEESSTISSTGEILFEPSLNTVLEKLLPEYISNVIFHSLLEAQCSELANRMNAMSNATNNARDIIDRLTIVYNKARQAVITQEISEIVGGAEALK